MFMRLLSRELSHTTITETRLNTFSPIRCLASQATFYTHKSLNSKRGGGGVGIYIHNSDKYKERTDLTIFANGIF